LGTKKEACKTQSQQKEEKVGHMVDTFLKNFQDGEKIRSNGGRMKNKNLFMVQNDGRNKDKLKENKK